ncbi:MAG: DUF2272 domain-containing protein [Firmicutes bacterium]|nr:DUF2272 domain-containing protein [Bacillota bacterium]
MKKRFLSLLLVLCMALSLCVVPVSAASPAVYDKMSASYKSGPYYTKLMNVNLTGNQIADLINVARSQVGYHASGSKSNLSGTATSGDGYVEYFNRISPSTMGNAWCATFVTWCFREAGIPTSIMPSATGCGKIRNTVKNQGATYHSRESGYKPKVGDIILYESMGGNYKYYVVKRDSNGFPTSTSHVGIVSGDYNASTGKFRTIQRSGAVVKEFYESINTKGPDANGKNTIYRIQGFVTPAYTSTKAVTGKLTMNFNANGGTVSASGFTQDSSGNVYKSGTKVANTWAYGHGSPEYGLWNATSFGLTKSGYEFLGWSLSKDGSSRIFDQDDTSLVAENIYSAVKNGDATVTLYAAWASTSYYLQFMNNYSSVNYLLNSDFTNDLDPYYWASRNTSVATVSIDRSNTHNGYNSLRVDSSAAGGSGKDLLIRTLTQGNKKDNNFVGDNKTMTLSFWAKSSNPGTSIHFRWGYESTGYHSVQLTTSWQKYVLVLNKTADFGDCFHPYIDAAGTVWLAELQLEDGSSATEFVPENGGIYAKLTEKAGGKYILPEDPVRDGYTFEGWYTAAEGGSLITSSTAVKDGNFRVYAHWTYDEPEYEPEEMGPDVDLETISFDPDEEEPASPIEPVTPETPSSNTIVMKIDDPLMLVNGKVTPVDELGNTPVIRNQRTMLPIASVMLAMNGTVGWDGSTKTVTLKRDGKTMFLRIGTSFAWDENGQAVAQLDSPPIIINGRTMLPVAAIVLYFGANISWDGTTRTVTITY